MSRGVAGIAFVTALVAGCVNDGPDADVARARESVVRIESQRCENPNRAHGQGVVFAGDLVVTAGHIVEGTLRSLTIDGQPASIVALDRNTDLAVLAVDLTASPPVEFSALHAADMVLLGPDGPQSVHVTGRETLVIEHATDHATYRRDVIVFTPGVAEGTSGSPVVDEQGRLTGIVILQDGDTGEGIAVDVSEMSGLLDAVSVAGDPEPIGSC